MTATMIKRRWKYGFKRWIVLGLLIAAGGLGFGLTAVYPGLKPVIPAVVLPGEELWPGAAILPPFAIGSFHFGGIPFTNTMLSTLLADLVLIVIALLVVRPFVRGTNPVPGKAYTALEILVEYFWNLVKDTMGEKWGRRVFPIMLTIFLLIVSANLVKMLPGYEVFGRIEEVPAGESATGTRPILPLVGSLYVLDGTAAPSACATETCYKLIPFLRGSATDLNFPGAMAVYVVACIFVFGVWAHGSGFFVRYFPIQRMINVPMFGLIDFFVGILEFVLEFVKAISLSLRLFGNIFAGGLLLLIIGSLTVVFIPAGLAAFELFVGVIQAYVFAMLALIFIQLSLVGHGEEKHGS
jgi:F-type H+-transporting ATPase subunit a